MAQDQAKVSFDIDISKAIDKLQAFEVAVRRIAQQEQVVKFTINYGTQGNLLDSTTRLKGLFNQLNSSGEGNYKIQRKIQRELESMQAAYRKNLDALQQSLNVQGLTNRQIKRTNAAIKETQNALNQILSVSNKVADSMRRSATNASDLGKALKGFKANNLGNLATAFDNLIVKLSIGGLIVEGFKQALYGIGELARQGADFEQLELSVQAFTNSLAEAKFTYQVFKDVAIKSPFSLPDVAQGGKTLLAFGLSATETAEALELLALSAGATGSDLNNLARNLGQIQAQQRAFKRDIDQFATAGIGIYKALEKATNQSTQAIKQQVSEGKIGYAEVLAALRLVAGEGSAFAEIAKQQLNTLKGQWGNLQTAVAEFAGALVKEVKGPALGAIKGLIGGLDFLGKNIGAIKDIFITLGLSIVALRLGPLIVSLTKLNATFIALKSANLIGLFAGAVPAAAAYGKTLEYVTSTARTVNGTLVLSRANTAALTASFRAAAGGIALFTGKLALLLVAVYAGYKAWEAWTKATAADEGVKKGISGVDTMTDSVKRLQLALDELNTKQNKSSWVDSIQDAVNQYRVLLARQREVTDENVKSKNAIDYINSAWKSVVIGFTQVLPEGEKFKNSMEEAYKILVSQTNQITAATSKSQEYASKVQQGSNALGRQLDVVKKVQATNEEALRVSKLMLAVFASQARDLANRQRSGQRLTAQEQRLLSYLTQQRDRLLDVVQVLQKDLAINKEITKEAERQKALLDQGQGLTPLESMKKELDTRKTLIDLAQQYWEIEKQGIKDKQEKDKEVFDAQIRAAENNKKSIEKQRDAERDASDERLRNLEKAKEAIGEFYDAQIEGLQERNIYEKQIQDNELEALRKKIEAGKFKNEGDALQSKADYQRLQDSLKIEELQKKKMQEQEAIQKRIAAEKEKAQELDKRLADGIERLADAIEKANQAQESKDKAIDNGIKARDRELEQQKKIYDLDEKTYKAREEGNTQAADLYTQQRNIASAVNDSSVGSANYTQGLQNAAEASQNLGAIIKTAEGNFAVFNQEAAKSKDSIGGIADSTGDVSSNIDTSINNMSEFNVTAQEALTTMQQLNAETQNWSGNSFDNLPTGRFTGGPVAANRIYRANELGQEAFLGASGLLSLIRTDRNGLWGAPEAGTVIPAHLTKLLDIPEPGLNIPITQAPISAGKIAKSTASAVSAAINDVASLHTQQAMELGKLSESIKHMTNKEWAVNVKIDNTSNDKLVHRIHRR